MLLAVWILVFAFLLHPVLRAMPHAVEGLAFLAGVLLIVVPYLASVARGASTRGEVDEALRREHARLLEQHERQMAESQRVIDTLKAMTEPGGTSSVRTPPAGPPPGPPAPSR